VKNDDFDYSYQYANWHSDTEESRRRDIEYTKRMFDSHGIYPESKNSRILEIGCGMGRLMLMLKSMGYDNMVGVDIDRSQIEIARKENLNVRLTDVSDFLREDRQKYDVIYCFDMLEHIDKDRQLPLLKLIFNATNDEGSVVFTVPNGLAPLAGFFRYIDFTHTVSYTENTMRFLLHNAGFHYAAVRSQHQECKEVQELKLPWARLYRMEFGLEDFILTPNLFTVAFKTQNALDTYLAKAPIIENRYSEKKRRSLWKRIKAWKLWGRQNPLS
jgi:2-polyprenyl-3-methyl-5-hydroxy-6-metoxy-1,4-benzoquinol methylase